MPTAREQHFRTKHHRADAPDILEEKKISTDKKELRNKNQSEREIWCMTSRRQRWYSQLSPRRTPLGSALSVCLREMSVL